MNFTIFSNRFLVAAYLIARDQGDEPLRSGDVFEAYELEAAPMWVHTALEDWRSRGWISGKGTVGDETSQRIRFTGQGLMRAETLLNIAQYQPKSRSKMSNVLAGEVVPVSDPLHGITIPASDRIVSLSHNQSAVVAPPIDNLVGALEADNGDPDQPGLREQILGEVRAGRELIRAGTFRSFLLYETLVRALGELIKRYSNPTIVALANALLGAVVSEILQAK